MGTFGLTGAPAPQGHRIDLRWSLPASAGRVRLVRREQTHPVDPDDGHIVVEGDRVATAVDDGLRGETVYYYALFAAAGGPLGRDPVDRTSALATARYDLAGLMYDLLPALYQRFDAAKRPSAGSVAAVDADHGVLRRFLDVPGAQLDQLYSLATAAQSVLDLDRVDGRLLPLVAQWVGWRTDHGAPVRVQRNEVRHAPDLYRAIGALPAAVATVNRVTGGAARVKEYVHNVVRTNQPPRLNLWSVTRDPAGSWGEPALLSMDAAFAGRVAHVREADGVDLLLYHTRRRHGWDLWAKRVMAGGGEPSVPVVDRSGDDLYPTAARQGERLWLFWESPAAPAPRSDPSAPRDDPGEQRSRLWFRVRTAEGWSDPAVFGAADTPSRRNAAAVADDTGGLWLFWRELTATGWRVRYDRHDGTSWLRGADPASLPDDAGAPVAVDDDLVALFHPSATAGRLWLFWARSAPTADGQRRWEIGFRVKRGLDVNANDWSSVTAVPKAAPGDHEREPAPLVTPAGNVELFTASTRDGGWRVLRRELTLPAATWGSTERVGGGTATDRAPLAFTGPDGGTSLVYRSATAPALTPDARVLDARYAGSTTVRVTDSAALARRGQLDDALTYTYQTGRAPVGGSRVRVRTDADRAARDTIGVFLDADPGAAAVARLAGVLPEFLPASVRAVVQRP